MTYDSFAIAGRHNEPLATEKEENMTGKIKPKNPPDERRPLQPAEGYVTSNGELIYDLTKAQRSQDLLDLDDIISIHLVESPDAAELVEFFDSHPLAFDLLKDLMNGAE